VLARYHSKSLEQRKLTDAPSPVNRGASICEGRHDVSARKAIVTDVLWYRELARSLGQSLFVGLLSHARVAVSRGSSCFLGGGFVGASGKVPSVLLCVDAPNGMSGG
jgi:hypothetical protein